MLTQSANCTGTGASTVMITGTMHIMAGNDPASVTTKPDSCTVTWAVVGATATLNAGQSCTGTGKDSGGPFTGMQSYFAGTIMTLDGKTATYHDSFHETKERGGAVYESCDIMRDATLAR